jgi:hypothetical protein
MKSAPRYSIERHDHGWLVCAKPFETSIPINALPECMKLFGKKAVMDLGIAHHYNAIKRTPFVVLAIGSEQDCTSWRNEIEEELKLSLPEDRWWMGTDVGKSSATIFGVMCQKWPDAREFGDGCYPLDASDFGRCKRLLDMFPEWRGRLHDVAEAYPKTAWPSIIARWSEIENSLTAEQNKILRGEL